MDALTNAQSQRTDGETGEVQTNNLQRVTPRNGNLHEAKTSKNDEFYTQLDDIEKEVMHYKQHFADKVVFCNCDDPVESNFWIYFERNFDHLRLKGLIATHYVAAGSSYKQEIVRVDGIKTQIPKAGLNGNGDFRSAECVELLERSDIVVTNPPFSLFREYLEQLIVHNKSFLIIGSKNAISYRDTFQLIMGNRLWIGINSVKRFRTPDGSMRAFGNIGWYTNIPHSKRNELQVLYRAYKGSEHNYPVYANYDAIEVAKVSEIPADYYGPMGVPVTFLDKYNPDQFEILGSSRRLGRPMSEVADKGTYVQGGTRFYLPNGDGTYRCLYDRIVIRRRQKCEPII